MTSAESDERATIRVVLADANVLYSRVLRDYLLYAATEGVLEIRWSAAILTEVIEHLAGNIAGFDATAGARLVAAMNGAFPAAEVDIRLVSADALLTLLVTEFPDGMLAAHRLAVSQLPGATDASTLAALHRAGAPNTANLMAGLLRVSTD